MDHLDADSVLLCFLHVQRVARSNRKPYSFLKWPRWEEMMRMERHRWASDENKYLVVVRAKPSFLANVKIDGGCELKIKLG